MNRHDSFGHRRHADDIGANVSQETIFGARFKIWSRHGNKDTTMDVNVLTTSEFHRALDQRMIIWLGHIGKAWSEPIVIDPNQRVVTHQINLIVDQHHITTAIVGIEPSAAANFLNDQELRLIIDEFSSQVDEARIALQDLRDATAETAPGVEAELAVILADLAEIDRQAVDRLRAIRDRS